MITVKDWMSKPVVTCKPGITVAEACVQMDHHNIGSLLISEDGVHADGIITERDILRKIVAADRDPKKTLVDEIMTKNVMSVEADTSLLHISNIMAKNVFRRVVVVENNKTIGIVTSRDLLEVMAG